MSKRKHSKIDMLEPDVKETVEEMIKSGVYYRDIAEYIRNHGMSISVAAVGNYAKNLMSTLDALRMSQENFRAIMEETERYPNLDMTEGILRIISSQMLTAVNQILDGSTILLQISDDEGTIYTEVRGLQEVIYTRYNSVFNQDEVKVNNIPEGFKVDHWTYNGIRIPDKDTETAEKLATYIRKQVDEASILKQEHGNTLIAYLVAEEPNIIINYRHEYNGYLSREQDKVTFAYLAKGGNDNNKLELNQSGVADANKEPVLDGSIAYAGPGFKFLYWVDEEGKIITNLSYLDYESHIKKYIPETEEELKKSSNYTQDSTDPDKGVFEYTFTAFFTDANPQGKVSYDINLTDGLIEDVLNEIPESVYKYGTEFSLAYIDALQTEQDEKFGKSERTDGDNREIQKTKKDPVSANNVTKDGKTTAVYITDNPIGYSERFYVAKAVPEIKDNPDYVFVAWYDGEKMNADGNIKAPQIVPSGSETEYTKYVLSSTQLDEEDNVYDFAAIWAIVELNEIIVPYDGNNHSIVKVKTSLPETMGSYGDEIEAIVGNGISAEIIGYSDTELSVNDSGWVSGTYQQINPKYDNAGKLTIYTPYLKIKLVLGNSSVEVVRQGSLTIVPAKVKLTKISTEKTAENKDIPLSGAVFQLYQNGSETPLKFTDKNIQSSTGTKTSFTTDTAGIITLHGLSEGVYYFKEVTPPTGYQKTAEKVYFHISEEDFTKDGDGNISATNEKVHSVTAENEPLMCELTVTKNIELPDGFDAEDVSMFGTPTFIIRVNGTATVTGKTNDYTKMISVDEGISGSVKFEVPLR